MNKKDLEQLKKASKILHKEWDKTKCPDKYVMCLQCMADRVISDLDDLINFMDLV